MAMGEAKALHQKTGEIVVFPEDRVFSKDTYWGVLFENLDYIVTPEESRFLDPKNLFIFTNDEHFTAYLDYQKTLKVKNKLCYLPYSPKPAEIVFSASAQDRLKSIKKNLGDFIFIDPHIKAGFSAMNKDWGFHNYQEVVNQLKVKFVQPDYGKPLLDGVTPVKTSHFLDGAALISISNTAIFSEGGLMHAAAAVNVPSVAIFGGFISPENTGYKMHKNFFVGKEPCGSLNQCSHCVKAMKKIHPRIVAKKLLKLYGKTIN